MQRRVAHHPGLRPLPATHKPTAQIFMTQKWTLDEDSKLESEGKTTAPFSCLPGGKQSRWFPISEPQPGCFLTQFTPLPLQRGANCTSWSCLPEGLCLSSGQAVFAQLPLLGATPGPQPSSRDGPSGDAGSVPAGLPLLRCLQPRDMLSPLRQHQEAFVPSSSSEAGDRASLSRL